MNKETVHSVKEKSIYRNAIQLNTLTKERSNEEGLMNHRRKEKKQKKWEEKEEKHNKTENREKEVETSRSQCN